jgi:hypothetical protein
MTLAPRASFVAALLVGLVAAPVASADDSPGRALLRRGIALRREGRNDEALAVFETANRLEPSPCAAAQIGLAHEARGEWLQGENALDAALAWPDDPWIRRHRDVLEGAVKAAAAHIGWLEVDADATQAEVVVAGVVTPASAGRIRLQEGPTSMVVQAPGYQALHQTVTIVPGVVARVAVVLQVDRALADDAPREPTREEASVKAADESRASAPSPTPLPPVAARVSTAPGVSRATASPWVVSAPLMAVGAVGLGLGAWFGLRATNAAGTREAHCSGQNCDDVGLAADHEARTWAGSSTALLAIGATAIVAGGVWLVVAPRSRTRIAFTAGPTSSVTLAGAL